ncbi:hypothetical protein [Robertkochia sediminum]|uniref:hypothetical protein n=1 Tax=Robertkochia sediminum TaxID=2785326 RepID=UPI001931384F|nr:hypothetical protein [Robertkochia sediminum]MBL7472036.1 hypothetical protein [Robertkochia sediminum]
MKLMNFMMYGLISMLLLITCADKQVAKPEVFRFGQSLAEIKERVAAFSDSVTVRPEEELQLPTARKSQAQLDVYGFMFAGKKRHVELIFADDQLDVVWILTDAEEEKRFIDALKKQFGEPTHKNDMFTFFIDDGVAVRNQPHEVLFISERLKAPYKQWLNGQG